MESEKVIEIKKVLECCSILTNRDLPMETRDDACHDCPYGDIERCTPLLVKNSLTLINELESENECYKQSCGAIGQNSLTIINQLKDRIAELEKENETKTNTISDLLKKQEFYEKEKLTKFVEKLKEQPQIKHIVDEGWIVSYVDICNTIDETLKECLGK